LPFLVVSTILAAVPAEANRGVDVTSTDHPVIAAVRTMQPPVLDGVLDDEVWTAASSFDDFYVPDLDRGPTEHTTIWIAYDDSCIYWAARMTEAHPELMRMEQTRRSGNVRNDDYIALGLDIANQHRHEGDHVFRVTPSGVQDERMPDGSATKVEWRGDWRAAAHIDSLGWSVEVSVPLAMFRRPAGPHTLGISAFRWHPRTQERIRWPNMGPSWDRTKAGDWVGVVWPKQSHRPTFMPYVVGDVTDGAGDGYFGADMKYTTPGGVSLVAAAYPDFRNVESEVLGLDFSYSEQFRRDNRAFFAEGRRYLPESWMFYTNRIDQVYGGGKVFGDAGNHRFGLVEAVDLDEASHMAGQWYWQPRPRMEFENKFGWRHGPAASVDPDFGPPLTDNLIYVSEARVGRMVGASTEYYRVQGGFTQSSGSVADGWNFEASWDRFPGNRQFGWHLKGRLLSAGFLAVDGLIDEEEADQKDLSTFLWYEAEYDRPHFTELGFEVHARNATRFDGSLYTRDFHGEVWVDFVSGTGMWVRVGDRNRPPNHDRTGRMVWWWLQDRLYTGGETGIEYGRVEGGEFLRTWVEQGVHPFQDYTIGLRLQYRRRDLAVGHEDQPEGGINHQYQLMATAQYDITTERAVSGRIISSHDGMNGYMTFQQVVRRGMDLFLIIGDPSAETWRSRIALKAMMVL